MTGASATPIRLRNVGTADENRARGKCFLVLGIVFIIIGLALLGFSLSSMAFVIGPSVVLTIWGVLCLFIAWRRFQMAKLLESNTSTVPTVSISGNITTQYGHPTVTVFQQSTTTTTGANTYGFQQQQYSTPYPSQFASSPPTYSSEAPPYSAYNSYSIPPTAPPTYSDATATK